MDTFDAISNRRSIRSFQQKEVEQNKLDEILNAAIQAPSAGNTQPWEFIVIKGQKQKEKLAQAAGGQGFVASAPVVIAVCANLNRSSSRYGDRGDTLYSIQDCANATMNLMLAAHSLGLGTCWVGAFSEEEAKQVLSLPEHVRPLAIIPVGYPAEEPSMPSRLNLDKVVHKEKF